jgi:hypothetical protein
LVLLKDIELGGRKSHLGKGRRGKKCSEKSSVLSLRRKQTEVEIVDIY